MTGPTSKSKSTTAIPTIHRRNISTTSCVIPKLSKSFCTFHGLLSTGSVLDLDIVRDRESLLVGIKGTEEGA